MGRVKSLEQIKSMVRERTGRQGVFRLGTPRDGTHDYPMAQGATGMKIKISSSKAG